MDLHKGLIAAENVYNPGDALGVFVELVYSADQGVLVVETPPVGPVLTPLRCLFLGLGLVCPLLVAPAGCLSRLSPMDPLLGWLGVPTGCLHHLLLFRSD